MYGARKDFDLARMRLNFICTQLGGLKNSLDSPLKTLEHDEEDENAQNEKVEDSDDDTNDRVDKVKLNGFHWINSFNIY